MRVLAADAAAARSVHCGLASCWRCPGLDCQPGAQHYARYHRAYGLGLVTLAGLAAARVAARSPLGSALVPNPPDLPPASAGEAGHGRPGGKGPGGGRGGP